MGKVRLDQLDLSELEEGEGQRVGKKLVSLMLLVNPENAKFKVVKEADDSYHISPTQDIVGYNFDVNYDQRAFGFGLWGSQPAVAIVDNGDMFYFYQK